MYNPDSKNEVPDLLESLQKRGISLAKLEAILGLPVRSTNRWNQGNCTASVVALLRIVTKYPHILDDLKKGF